MNLEQLEKIKEKLEEIDTLIESDRFGCINVKKAYDSFSDAVNSELEQQIVSCYRSGKLTKKKE